MITLLKKTGDERTIAFFIVFVTLFSSESVYSQALTAADSAVRNASVFVGFAPGKLQGFGNPYQNPINATEYFIMSQLFRRVFVDGYRMMCGFIDYI